MALNSSGPISLGGATTGQSINLELAQSSITTVSLNDTNVRALAGVSSGVITMPTDFWGKSAASYFWSIMNIPEKTGGSIGFFLCPDTSNNFYMQMQLASNASSLYKINSTGTSILAQRSYTNTVGTGSVVSTGIAVSGSNLIAIGTRRYRASPNRNGGSIDIYDTASLTLQTERMYYPAGTNTAGSFVGMYPRPDSSGNVYFNGTARTSIGTQCAIFKFDPTTLALTTLEETNPLNIASGNGNGVALDLANNNTYTNFNYSSPQNRANLAKFNSSFSLVWSNVTGSDNSETFLVAAAYNDNVYLPVGSSSATSVFASGVAKIDASTGAFSSPIKSYFSLPNNTNFVIAITTDTSGNCYVVQNTTGTTGNAVLFKFNTSMVLQWQRSIVCVNCGVGNIQTFPNGNLVLSLFDTLSLGVNPQFFTYPTDGSLTGSWSSGSYGLTIAASSYSETSTSISMASTLSWASQTLPNQTNPASTIGTPTATITKVSL
jgi:hypothetical protein